jgi:hypothetical protein
VVEHSVYVGPGYHRRGIGSLLLRALIASSEAAGIWTIQSSIFPEHTACLGPVGRQTDSIASSPKGLCPIGLGPSARDLRIYLTMESIGPPTSGTAAVLVVLEQRERQHGSIRDPPSTAGLADDLLLQKCLIAVTGLSGGRRASRP